METRANKHKHTLLQPCGVWFSAASCGAQGSRAGSPEARALSAAWQHYIEPWVLVSYILLPPPEPPYQAHFPHAIK